MTDPSLSETFIKRILDECKTIALVGASANPERPSHDVMSFLLDKGYKVVPVNPTLAGSRILGQDVFASLTEIPFPIDMVDVFRDASAVPGIVEDAIAIKAKCIWTQLGVRHDEAAIRAREAGLDVVMDRCPKIELLRMSGQSH